MTQKKLFPVKSELNESLKLCESPIEKKVCIALYLLKNKLSKQGTTIKIIPQHTLERIITLDNRGHWCNNDCNSCSGSDYGKHDSCNFIHHPTQEVARLDFAVFVGKRKFDIECDGKYFHDISKDKERDNNVLNLGFKTIRLKGEEIYEWSEKSIGSIIWRNMNE